MARAGWMKCGGVTMILIGATVLIVGLVVTPKEFGRVFDYELDKYLVVDSTKAQQYDDWAGNSDVLNPYYLVVYMYNLTNLDDVIQKFQLPNYTTHGPYMFRRYRKSVNVSFLEGGDLVQYNDFMDFVFDANASGGLSDTDVFVNINPVAIGGLMQATIPGSSSSGEANMLSAAAGGLIKGITGYFTGPFISLFNALKLPNYLIPIMKANIAALGDNQTAYDTFIDTWRNGTTAPALGNWTGLLLNGSGTPAGISVSSAQRLLNASIPYSLLNGTYESAWYWDQALVNTTISQILTSTFQITPEQLATIWNWRNTRFGPTRMYPDLINTWGLDQISDLGWVQYVTLDPLDDFSVYDVFPDFASTGYYTEIELDSSTAGWREWRTILADNTGLGNITTFQAFLMQFNQNQNSDFSPWGLNATTARDLIGSVVGNLLEEQVVPAVTNLMGPSGGLFISRTVSQWTFYCDDYLLNLLREDPPLCSFRYNHSALDANVVMTGKSKISSINTFTIWQNQTQVDAWNMPINVSGHTELGQFDPSHNHSEPLSVFQADTVRTVYLNYTSNSTVKGIDTDRYMLDFPRTFGISDLYFQSQVGLANMSSIHSGSPIFLSLWDMLYVKNATGMVIGLNATNEYEDSTVIDVEPTTGITVQSKKRLQVNVWVPPSNLDWFGSDGSIFGNQHFTTGIVYPIAKIGEYATVSDSQANLLRSKLSLSPRVKHAAFFVGVTVGPVLIVLGFGLFYLLHAKRQDREKEKERLINRE